MTSSDADALALLVDQGAADHVRWVARSHEAILERWVDGYTIDVRRRESDVRAAIEAADRGEVIAADEVLRWVGTWGTPDEERKDAD